MYNTCECYTRSATRGLHNERGPTREPDACREPRVWQILQARPVPEGERSVSEELPERLSAILTEVDTVIGDAEAGISASGRDLSALLEALEEERAQTNSALEEIRLERFVLEAEPDSESDEQDDQHELELRQREAKLAASVGRVSSLQQQIGDFGHLLTAARRQFGSDEELPGVDDAKEMSLRQAMIRAKEEERRRLSREIHDGPAQVLANAIIGLEFIERSLRQAESTAEAPAVNEIERIKSSMRDGLSEIRRFIFDLRPSMLAQRGLVGTVEHYVNAYRSFLPDEISLDLPTTSPDLSEEQELTAFRVIQESIQNVHRHSDATKCWIAIENADQATVITVRDNGRGFSPDSVRVHSAGGSGILGMQERAEVIGARLSLQSEPAKGSEIYLEIPVSTHAGTSSRESVAEQRRTR